MFFVRQSSLMAAVTGIACNRFTGPCTASAAAPVFTKNAGCCRRYGSCPTCSHAFCCLYCSPHTRMASMMGCRLRPLAGRFFYFTAQTRCLSSRGRAPRTSGSKNFFAVQIARNRRFTAKVSESQPVKSHPPVTRLPHCAYFTPGKKGCIMASSAGARRDAPHTQCNNPGGTKPCL